MVTLFHIVTFWANRVFTLMACPRAVLSRLCPMMICQSGVSKCRFVLWQSSKVAFLSKWRYHMLYHFSRFTYFVLWHFSYWHFVSCGILDTVLFSDNWSAWRFFCYIVSEWNFFLFHFLSVTFFLWNFVSVSFCPVKFYLSDVLSMWHFDYLMLCPNRNFLVKFCFCYVFSVGVLSEWSFVKRNFGCVMDFFKSTLNFSKAYQKVFKNTQSFWKFS